LPAITGTNLRNQEETAEESVAAARLSSSTSYPPLAQRLTLASMDNPYWKSQPTPTHWAVGWADLMMTMFVLFLVLYLYQSTQQRPAAERNEPSERIKAAQIAATPPAREGQAAQLSFKSGSEGQSGPGPLAAGATKPGIDDTHGTNAPGGLEMVKLYDMAKLTLKDKDLEKFAKIELSLDRTVRIILDADLIFPSGKADLRPAVREQVNRLAALLKSTPHMINVVGHTDNIPIRSGPFATNWELSVMRATTVARLLIEEMGIPASRISITGYSFYQPQADNDSPANRARNRRVEIIVSREPSPTLPAADNPGALQ
jgi:chemotaxis protein MotB